MRVAIGDDFDLYKITESGQCFRVRALGDGTFRFLAGGRALYIRELSPGSFEADCTEEDWRRVWAAYFDLGRDYRRICQGIPEEDTYMRRAAEAGRGIRILRQDPWETLATFILSQRKSIPAIRGAVEFLAARFGEVFVTARETLHAFPAPERLAEAGDDELRECKLGYRAPYLRDAAEKVLTGEVDLAAIGELPDRELLEKLKTVRGVGDKVAGCVCLFAYGRTGLAPIDTWIRKTIAREYGGVNPFSGYGGAAGIMQQYAFYYAITHKTALGAPAPPPRP